MYHYAGNNPVKYTDPDGREDIDWEQYADRINSERQSYIESHINEWDGSRMGESSMPDASLSVINTQIASNPNDYHCDIYAWNQAIENGRDPRGQNGETPDLNGINVSTMYQYYPNNRNVGAPPENTEGYAFYDGTDNGIDDPTHVEYYTYQSGGTYTRYNTGGILPPVPEQRGVADDRNRNWIYVPLQNRN